jgi:enterochelin esterase-like enzyme
VRMVFALLALLSFGCAPSGHAGEIRHESFASSLLGRDMPYVVYVPDGYETSRQWYPVLYLLHGAGGDEKAWSNRGHIAETADALIRKGEVPPALIVMPGCPNCWWVDGAKDKAETAFWAELVPAIAKRYRTIETREGRVIAGLSAGGYGAVRFALKYPDRLAAAAAFSPAVYSTTPPATSAARTQPPFLGADGNFSQAAWTARNYPQLTEHYFSQPFRVPMYLVSGDNDRLGIAFETALLFKTMYDQQPSMTELRIVDGDHNWAVWSNAIGDAMKYMFRFTTPPVSGPRPSQSQPVVAARPR